MQVGIDTLIFVLLALGLNVAVGWVGPPRPRLRRLLRDRRVPVRGAGFGVRGPPLGCRDRDSADRRRRCGHRLSRRAAVTSPRRRLPRDRDALLPPALARRPHQRVVVARAERHLGHLSARVLRTAGHVARRLVLRRPRRVRRHHLVPLPPEPVANRTRLEGAARGRARGRADDDAGGPAEADGVRGGRRRRGRRGSDLRAGARRRLPGELRPRPPDHRVRDGRPRRRGQPGRRNGRRGADQRIPGGAA